MAAGFDVQHLHGWSWLAKAARACSSTWSGRMSRRQV
jgi:hypothetical protein